MSIESTLKTNTPLKHGEKYENNKTKQSGKKSASFNIHLILALYHSHVKEDNKTVYDFFYLIYESTETKLSKITKIHFLRGHTYSMMFL